MKVRALKKFEGIRDIERDVFPKEGDIWEVSEERAKFLKKHGVVEFVKEEKKDNNTIEMEVSFDSEKAIKKVKEIAENGGSEEEAIKEVEKIINKTLEVKPKPNKKKKHSKK